MTAPCPENWRSAIMTRIMRKGCSTFGEAKDHEEGKKLKDYDINGKEKFKNGGKDDEEKSKDHNQEKSKDN